MTTSEEPLNLPKLIGLSIVLATGPVALAEPPQTGEAENPGGEFGLMGQPGAETLNQRAQQADPTQGTPGKQLGIDETQPTPDHAALSDVSLDKAFALPASAARLRGAGFPEREVEQALDAAKDAGIEASEASVLLDTMLTMPMPTSEQVLGELGEVVEENVEEGLRGPALLTAIHADLMARAAAETDDATQYDPGHGRPITDPAQ